jgi:hypothetical protein
MLNELLTLGYFSLASMTHEALMSSCKKRVKIAPALGESALLHFIVAVFNRVHAL